MDAKKTKRNARFHFKTLLVPFPVAITKLEMADVYKNGCGLTLPTLCMCGMRYI